MNREELFKELRATLLRQMELQREHKDFVRESNKIEGIIRKPTQEELETHSWFVDLDEITIPDLEEFVSIYQPDAKLRDKKGMNVYVGHYMPPDGGSYIRQRLEIILNQPSTPYGIHCAYENLHPFTDGNGRSGRALWSWKMKQLEMPAGLGFLRTWYYQSLENSGRELYRALI